MGAIIALAKKDLLLLLRDKAGLFFALGFPLVMAVFFGTIFGGGGGGGGSSEPAGISVAVVDEDATAASSAFVDQLDASGDFEVTRSGSRESAADSVRRGTRSAAVVLTPGFGAASERVFWGAPATIEVIYDPSRGAESAMIEGMLMKLAFSGLGEKLSDADSVQTSNAEALRSLEDADDMGPLAKASLRELIGAVDTFFATGSESWMEEEEGGSPVGQMQWQPIAIETRSVREIETAGNQEEGDKGPGSGYDVSFPQGVMWALIGVSAAFGVSLVQERSGGTLRRLRVAPISRGDVLLGKALACYVSIIVASAALLVFGIVVFGVRPGSPLLLLMGMACAAVCFTGLMMLLSVLGKTEQAASGIGWAVLLLLAMFGGAMVPLFIMPGWMQSMASFSPVKWAILAIEGPLWRGFGVSEMLIPCGVLLAVGAGTFGIGAGVFGRMEES